MLVLIVIGIIMISLLISFRPTTDQHSVSKQIDNTLHTEHQTSERLEHHIVENKGEEQQVSQCELAWQSYFREEIQPVTLRELDNTNFQRIKVENLFVVSVFISNEDQARLIFKNVNNILNIFPTATVCVVDNGSLYNYSLDLPTTVCFIDNSEQVKKGFGFEFSAYLTALQKYEPTGFLVAIQGSLVLQKVFSFEELRNRQPDPTKQIYSVKCFSPLLMDDIDGFFVYTVAKQFNLFLPAKTTQANGVFGCNFICSGTVAEELRNGLLRVQVKEKKHSCACERILGLYVHSKGVDPLLQSLDGQIIHFQFAKRTDSLENNPFYFWKVFFGNA